MEFKDRLKQIAERGFNLNRIFGIILLIPPLYSVFLFLFTDSSNLNDFKGTSWTFGKLYDGEPGMGGDIAGVATSALPLYFGLMAIAGAILLSNSNKK